MGTKLTLNEINKQLYKKDKGKEKQIYLPKKNKDEHKDNKNT